MAAKKLRLGVDTGGTFTDAVIMDEESGEFIIDKVSSTPSDPSISFQQIVSQVLERLGVKHGGGHLLGPRDDRGYQ